MSVEHGNKVRAEIIEIMGAGTCPSGFEVGRSWILSDSRCPEDMCTWAYNSMLPFVSALSCGGRFPWSGEQTARLCCPDADNPVVYRLTIEP